MKINGTLKTEQGRILPFEIKTNELLENEKCYWDNGFCGNYVINSGYSIAVDTQEIEQSNEGLVKSNLIHSNMFKNALVDSIETIEFTDSEKENIYKTVKERVDDEIDADYLESYGIYSSDEIETEWYLDDLMYEVEEYFNVENYPFRRLVTDFFELSNGYEGWSQWDRAYEHLFNDVLDKIVDHLEYSKQCEQEYLNEIS